MSTNTAKVVSIMPESGLERIGVEKAKLYLEKNKHNRPINEVNLQDITHKMNSGIWTNTGETIKFDINGELIDGQHRLLGIVRSGKSQEIFVIRHLPPDAFRHIDTGRMRTAGDVLGIEGVSNPQKIASLAKFVMLFQRGKYGMMQSNNKIARLSNDDIANFVLSNKVELAESFKVGYHKSNKILSGTYMAAFHYIFNTISPEAAEDFCYKLSTGLDLKEKHPIYVLRFHFHNDIRSKRKMPFLQKIAFICKTWNLYRQGKTITQLRWEATSDPFPKPI